MRIQWRVPKEEEATSEDMIALEWLIDFLHDLPIEWEGDDSGIHFYNTGVQEPLRFYPGDIMSWDPETKVMSKAEQW